MSGNPCANCRREVEPDGDDWGHVAAALPESDPAAVEFWANPCADPQPTAPSPLLAASTEQLAAWRENRDPGWHRDIGYQLQDVLNAHHYDTRDRGQRPDDPGWHVCSCGWEGYWSDFHPHVTDHLRALAAALEDR